MIYTIQNNYLEIQIASKGGELQSIKSNDGNEYLWQGNPEYWGDRAPNLFPYIARLTDGKYIFEGEEYQMDIHGFLKDFDMQLVEKDRDKLSLCMISDATTLAQYPFRFRFVLTYELYQNKLEITYRVENMENKKMYFAIGGHPGFHVPMETKLRFEDYYLEFAGDCAPKRIEFSKDCFVTGSTAPFELCDKKIPLSHSMFDCDAIVLKDMCDEVVLKSDKGRSSVQVTFPQMKYLGIWHWPQSNAPYVCIEPWSSLPSRKDIIEDLAKQEDLISLNGGQCYENRWYITITTPTDNF